MFAGGCRTCWYQAGAARRLRCYEEVAEYVPWPRDLCSTWQAGGHAGRVAQDLGLPKFAAVWVANSFIHSGLLVRITARMLSNLQFIPSNKLLRCSLAVLRNEVI